MKKITLVFTVIVCLVIGYFLGNTFPLNNFNADLLPDSESALSEGQGIQGDIRVEITLEMDNGTPIGNVEMDLAEQPGPPPEGGVALTDASGLAVFNVKAGNYFIFFNNNNFPSNLKMPEARQIQVEENQNNKATVVVATQD